MMANRAKRGGTFLKAPPTQPANSATPSPPSTGKTSKPLKDSLQDPAAKADGTEQAYSTLLSYLTGSMQSQWLGVPAPAWLQDESGPQARAMAAPLGGMGAAGGRAAVGAMAAPAPFDQEAEVKAAAAAQAARRAKDAAKQRKGIVLPPPASLQGAKTRPLPPLPGTQGFQALKQPPGSSGPHASVEASPSGRVYVFWDLEEKHPGSVDPRLVSHRLRQVAAEYGQVCGIYAYATRKVSNWVPDALYEAAMDARAQAREQQQQRQQQQGAPAAAAAAGEEKEGTGQHRCPVCGAVRRTEAEVETHMEALHGRRGRGGRGGPGGGGAPRNGANRGVGRVQRYHNSAGVAFVPPEGHQLSLRYVLRCEGVDARIAQNAQEDSGLALASGLVKLLVQLQQGELPEQGQEFVGDQQALVGAGGGEVAAGGGAGAMGLADGVRPVVLVVSDDVRLARQLARLRDAGFGVVLASSNVQALAAAAGQRGVPAGRRAGKGAASGPAAVPPMVSVADVVLDWEAVRWGEYAT